MMLASCRSSPPSTGEAGAQVSPSPSVERLDAARADVQSRDAVAPDALGRASTLARLAYTAGRGSIVVEHVSFDEQSPHHSTSANGCGLALVVVAAGSLVVSSPLEPDAVLAEGTWASSANGELEMWAPRGQRAEAVTLSHAAGCKPTLGMRSVTEASSVAMNIPGADPSIHVWPDFNPGGSVFGGRLSGAGRVPPHVHADATEIIVVLEGSGSLDVEGSSYPLERGKIVKVGPRKRHGWTSEAELKAIVFYLPGGPELKLTRAKPH